MKFEIFEVFNNKNKRVFYTNQISCIPNKTQLNSMIKNNYKIRIDNKTLTRKMIDELLIKCKE